MSVLSNSRKEALEKAFGEHGNGLVKQLIVTFQVNCNMRSKLQHT